MFGIGNDLSILMPSPKFRFVKPDGKSNSIFMPVVLYAIGIKGRMALTKSGLGKTR